MNILKLKYRYYRAWFAAMSQDERESTTGIWVFDRMLLFSDLLREQDKAVQQFRRNCLYGNYKGVLG